jgi:hypothetical protein
LRLPFSSPPTTRRVTVEVFDPASTRGLVCACYISLEQTMQKMLLPTFLQLSRQVFIIVETCLSSHCLATAISSGLQPLYYNIICSYNKLTLHLVHSSEIVERWIHGDHCDLHFWEGIWTIRLHGMETAGENVFQYLL